MNLESVRRKGQVKFFLIPMMIIILLIFYAGFMPTINTFIAAILPELDTGSAVMLRLLPFVMIGMMLISVVFWSSSR